MANSLRAVKNRINSTKSTAQITKAMYMVSQSKVKRAEKTYKSYQDFMKRIEALVSSILYKAKDEYPHKLLVEREIKKTAYFIVTSDTGLAGAYNSSIFKAFEEKLAENNQTKKDVITGAIGKKGYYYLKSNGYKIMNDSRINVRDDVMFLDIEPLARKFINAYLNGEIDKLVIVYNHYVNSLTQEVKFEELLPIKNIEAEESKVDFIYETGIEKTLDLILPMYVKDMVFGIVLDAKTSEHSARMNAMKSATDNALEIIDKLQLLYNRARQSVVTNELIDIIGGANAIGGDQ